MIVQDAAGEAMRSIAVMDTFCSFGVCIEGDPRQGRHFPLNIQFLLACVVFLSVCVSVLRSAR